MKIKKITVAVFLFFIFFRPFFAKEKSSAEKANRKTATRFLRLAENYFSQKEFDKALNEADMGLSYDESVSDLLYIKAAIFAEQKKPRAEIFSLMEKAFSYDDWASYDEEAARILYADVLCDRGDMQKAMAVLDEKKFLYSSDAELIRIKAFYKMHTKDAISKARDKIALVRKIYPKDLRFAKIFFRNEYAIAEQPSPEIVKRIAQSIAEALPDYDANDSELEIFASVFSSGEAKTRLLKSFAAHNLRHPLYALLAAGEKLISETDAVEYFFGFAEKQIPLSLLERFSKAINEPDAKKLLHDYLASFSGVVTTDTDFDANANFFVEYKRGRPSMIFIDRNNDDVQDWVSLCDFGEPRAFTKNNITLTYGRYPFVQSASVQGKDGERRFLLEEKKFSYTPFSIKKNEIISANANVDFFVPIPNAKEIEMNERELFAVCTSFETPISEKENAKATFTVLNGVMQSAEFFAGEKKYAKARFKNGLPFSRALDNDGDGIFEETQFFSYDADAKRTDESAFRNVFFLPKDSHFYISKITLDVNADSVVDFTTEYGANGDETSSWDFDNDGEWEMQTISYAQTGSEKIEEARFYRLPEKQSVSITSVNGEPAFVMQGGIRYEVQKGFARAVYWLGDKGSENDERTALSALENVKLQGVCTLAENAGHRVLAVRIGDKRYCSLIYFEEKTDSHQ